MLPDLENADFYCKGEHTDGERERRIREVGIQSITQVTAIAKVNRALRTRTTTDGHRLYKPGDLMDYHRPTSTKDEHGGWNGPYPVVRNLPESGQVVCNVGNREVKVQYPDARLTLFVVCLIANDNGWISTDNQAVQLIIKYIAELPSGKAPEISDTLQNNTSLPL